MPPPKQSWASARETRSNPKPVSQDRSHEEIGNNGEALVNPEELSRAALEDGSRHARRQEETEPDQESDGEAACDLALSTRSRAWRRRPLS